MAEPRPTRAALQVHVATGLIACTAQSAPKPTVFWCPFGSAPSAIVWSETLFIKAPQGCSADDQLLVQILTGCFRA
jgi:hypothetical protein